MNIGWLEGIWWYVAISMLIGYLVLGIILIYFKNKKLLAMYTQAELDRVSVILEAQEILKREAERTAGDGGFVKFVSQSRDWAFEYIENVQKDLQELKSFVDEHGSAPQKVGEVKQLHNLIMKAIENLPKDG